MMGIETIAAIATVAVAAAGTAVSIANAPKTPTVPKPPVPPLPPNQAAPPPQAPTETLIGKRAATQKRQRDLGFGLDQTLLTAPQLGNVGGAGADTIIGGGLGRAKRTGAG